MTLLATEYTWRREITYSSLSVFFIASHLALDLIDRSGVYPPYPIVETGIGLTYSMEIVLARGGSTLPCKGSQYSVLDDASGRVRN
ncbi:hypothetical protein CV102_22490 [Natronococcus pandeyae]|uniref:Uncharacterized protein n=1 Tax=Natronococcus pandeyae TaxID=2055836 RepID=A0A8J8TNK0_9EURY|nr:hypothetical protein [Natronococcus pandeyae]TYL36398.1 hypothetical protein CV102_22490 [Natronococcus pandeyae]